MAVRKGLPKEHLEVINDYVLRQKENVNTNPYDGTVHALLTGKVKTPYSPVKVEEPCPPDAKKLLPSSTVRMISCPNQSYDQESD